MNDKTYSRLVTFIISFVLWCLLSFSFDIQHLILGLLVATFVALFMGDMFTSEAFKWFQIQRYFWFFRYLLVFVWECIKANIDVAIRVLHPKLPINPGIVKVKTSLKTETALTLLANSITLTPGTFTVDVEEKEGILYIHWIDVVTQDIDKASEIIVKRFEDILKKVLE